MKREIILPVFSAKLRELRKARNLTQKNMAELLQCTIRHYQMVEYGQINIPVSTLIILADYFSVSTDYLLGRTDVHEYKGRV